MVGDLTSEFGAVALGADATCAGSVTSLIGTVSFGAGAESGDITGKTAVSLGANTKAVNIQTDGLLTMGAGAEVTGTITSFGGQAAAAGVSMGLGAKAEGLLSTDLIGSLLLPNRYEAAGAITNSGTVSLLVPDYLLTDSEGRDQSNPDALPIVWIFQIDGAFSAAAGSKVVFNKEFDGSEITVSHPDFAALAAAVTWKVDGAITLGASAKFVGHMISNTADITLGASAESGPLTATLGAVTMGASAKATGIVYGATVTLGAGASDNAVVLLPAMELFTIIRDTCPQDTTLNNCPDPPVSPCCILASRIPGVKDPVVVQNRKV
jgi:hypothetical protein